MVKEREEQIREEYDRVLASKLTGKYMYCIIIFLFLKMHFHYKKNHCLVMNIINDVHKLGVALLIDGFIYT